MDFVFSILDFRKMNSDDIDVFNKDLIKYCIDPSDTRYLNRIDSSELNQILPFLVRLWKNSVHTEIKNTKYKREIFKKIIKSNKSNNIFFYLQADFSEIYDDIIRTLSIRYSIFYKLDLSYKKINSNFF